MMKQQAFEIEYGLCGMPLGHSMSVQIQAQLGNNSYELLECTETQFRSIIETRNFKGLNVTIPYKKLAYSLCDSVSDIARDTGVVNTILNKNGVILGYNTDVYGFEETTRDISFGGRRVIILGTGGTSQTAGFVAKKHGASEIVYISRTKHPTYEEINKYSDWEILINTTPIGMYPNIDEVPLDIAIFNNLEGVIDVIYNPTETKLLGNARKMGIKVASGMEMLKKQAEFSNKIWKNTDCF